MLTISVSDPPAIFRPKLFDPLSMMMDVWVFWSIGAVKGPESRSFGSSVVANPSAVVPEAIKMLKGGILLRRMLV